MVLVTSSKNSYPHKCVKHHKCDKDEELCSNKFIQVVIVVLVLIMAFWYGLVELGLIFL